ncbi:MAG: hypothetical protein ACREP6_09975 [Candidatus Binataceae bacterium]
MEVEDLVTNLIAACRDDANSYWRASEILFDQPDIAHFCEEEAQNRDLAADVLEKRLSASGKKPNPKILLAPAAEGWSQPGPGDRDVKAVIEACHTAEERTIKMFEEAEGTFPDQWRWEIGEHYQNMRSAAAKLHAWLQNKEIGPEFG